MENPFCTRRVKPGAVGFVFPPGMDVDTVVDRLRQTGWWGEIVGPHGSGKSTLLATLIPAIERAGHAAVVVSLHDRQRRLPIDVRSDVRLPAVLIVDGYEQLSRWSRMKLKWLCRRREIGLLVTAHKSVGYPTIYQTAATPELAVQIVGVLLEGRATSFTPQEVSQSLSQRGGDLREALFDLYDLYEKRRPSSGQNVT
jgi:hypothetical protein